MVAANQPIEPLATYPVPSTVANPTPQHVATKHTAIIPKAIEATLRTSNPYPANETQTSKVSQPVVALVKLGSQTTAASRLNESLSLLGYLPVSFSPAHKMSTKIAMSDLASGSNDATLPGSYHFFHSSTGKQLGSLWQPSSDNIMTQGAVMRFELDHHLVVDGIAGPHVWHAINVALTNHDVATQPYVFVTVSERAPEVLKVWKSGKVVLSTPANTGISQSPTDIGTWPIYLRYRSQEMKGTTPWGTTYADPGVPFVSYFHGGDAIHGFTRPSYGSPQSLGCVEIPIATSKTVYSLVNYGTLVSVRK